MRSPASATRATNRLSIDQRITLKALVIDDKYRHSVVGQHSTLEFDAYFILAIAMLDGHWINALEMFAQTYDVDEWYRSEPSKNSRCTSALTAMSTESRAPEFENMGSLFARTLHELSFAGSFSDESHCSQKPLIKL